MGKCKQTVKKEKKEKEYVFGSHVETNFAKPLKL